MARIAGIDLPANKRMVIALTYIYGIGKMASRKILEKVKISLEKKSKDLTDTEITKLRKEIENYRVEGELKAEVNANIKRLKEIGSYRGMRHKRKLPARGQRTHTNARTHKGPRPQIGGKKRSK